MSKGWLLFWTAFFIAGAVNDISSDYVPFGIFELIMGIGIGAHTLIRYFKEV